MDVFSVEMGTGDLAEFPTSPKPEITRLGHITSVRWIEDGTQREWHVDSGEPVPEDAPFRFVE